MSEAGAALDALRRSGAADRDPVRFRTLEALARRLQEQPAPVRRLLQARLEAGLAELAQHAAPAVARKTPRHATAASPLAQLNADLQERIGNADELRSARRFRVAWERTRSLDQVEHAVARGPAQAGPLNSHALVLRSLERLRELSPAYLRRFLGHVQTLQWLEDARTAAAPAKAAPRRRAKK